MSCPSQHCQCRPVCNPLCKTYCIKWKCCGKKYKTKFEVCDGSTGPTGAPGISPTGHTGEGFTGARGPTGDSITGPTGQNGTDSTIPGPTGPTGQNGADSNVTGPTGAASNVAGPTGPIGADSNVTGPTGPIGADSNVTGPTGPIGAGSNVTGPIGPTGANSTVAGPTGPIGNTGPTGTFASPSVVVTLAAAGTTIGLSVSDQFFDVFPASSPSVTAVRFGDSSLYDTTSGFTPTSSGIWELNFTLNINAENGVGGISVKLQNAALTGIWALKQQAANPSGGGGAADNVISASWTVDTAIYPGPYQLLASVVTVKGSPIVTASQFGLFSTCASFKKISN